MKLHSNVITLQDINAATSGMPNVYAEVATKGSRSHSAAFEISLEGNGYRGNSGQYGARDMSQPLSATWDEWGVFIGRLFVIDPDAVWGSVKNPVYRNAQHFHWVTGNRFAPSNVLRETDPRILGTRDLINLPADTHKRHSWVWNAGSAYCKKCSAVQRHIRVSAGAL